MLLLHLAPEGIGSLAPHRTRPGWEICQENDSIWLRCPSASGALETIAGLPCRGRYQVDDQGRLIPQQATLPVALEPSGVWLPLGDFLKPEPFPPVLPGRMRNRLAIKLERASHEIAAGALLTSLHDLMTWAEQASRLRLNRLKFAAAGDGRVFAVGNPLPPVFGAAYYFQGALAMPCGWDFVPPLLPAWVEQSLALPPGAVALLDPGAVVEVISQEAFTPLTLAAVRRTASTAISWKVT